MIRSICAVSALKLTITLVTILCFPTISLAANANGGQLPGAYFGLLEAGATQVETRLNAEPLATLETLEALPGWACRHSENSCP
jgi:hypothetical protein